MLWIKQDSLYCRLISIQVGNETEEKQIREFIEKQIAAGSIPEDLAQ